MADQWAAGSSGTIHLFIERGIKQKPEVTPLLSRPSLPHNLPTYTPAYILKKRAVSILREIKGYPTQDFIKES